MPNKIGISSMTLCHCRSLPEPSGAPTPINPDYPTHPEPPRPQFGSYNRQVCGLLPTVAHPNASDNVYILRSYQY